MDETSRAIGALEGKVEALEGSILLFQKATHEAIAELAASQSKAIADLAASQSKAMENLAGSVDNLEQQHDRLRNTGAGVLAGIAMASGSAGAMLKDVVVKVING